MSVDPALLEERDFLLGSLDDLEAEYAAGDLDDAVSTVSVESSRSTTTDRSLGCLLYTSDAADEV